MKIFPQYNVTQNKGEHRVLWEQNWIKIFIKASNEKNYNSLSCEINIIIINEYGRQLNRKLGILLELVHTKGYPNFQQIYEKVFNFNSH